MKLKLLRQSLFILLIGSLGLLSACEGGKNKASPCPGASSQYTTNCQPPACPSGQERVNGLCELSKSRCNSGYMLSNDICVLACPDGEHLEDGQCLIDDIALEIVNQPYGCTTGTGRVQFIVRFIARDEEGFTIDPELDAQNQPTLMTSQILIDDIPLSIETIIERDSELLQSDMVLSLVLDSSSSMLAHSPPAFEPMKTAAISILTDTKSTWENNNSQFIWELSWFNEYIHRPAANLVGEPWTIIDIAQIPEPPNGSITGLYKAVVHMAGVHKAHYDNMKAAQEGDQHIMIVLSDGEDNHSFFDNSAHSALINNTDETLFWDQFGYPSTNNTTDLQAALDAVPNLRVHVIGLGDAAIDEELQPIADFGNGLYFSGATSETLGQVFRDVQKEFITVQTLGIQVPLEPGSYLLSLRVRHAQTQAEGRKDFNLTVSSGLPACE